MAKVGRPKSQDPRDVIVTVRFTKSEYDCVKRLAAYHDITVSKLIKKGLSSLQNDDCFSESSVDEIGGTENGNEKRQQGQGSQKGRVPENPR